MNLYNVTIDLEDCICMENCKQCFNKSVTITSTTQCINLQCSYILNVIDITDTYFTVLIQNGIETIIRRVYFNSPIKLCIPNRCGNHILSISGTLIILQQD